MQRNRGGKGGGEVGAEGGGEDNKVKDENIAKGRQKMVVVKMEVQILEVEEKQALGGEDEEEEEQ